LLNLHFLTIFGCYIYFDLLHKKVGGKKESEIDWQLYI